jgi:N6-L-threonylcarbamoyladenine synthase
MILLGIETSCDETSAAVVEDGRLVLSNVVSSQIAQHAPFGGVVPEIASRQHVTAIGRVTDLALREAGVPREALDVVAATQGPGLAGALLVGVNFARAFSLGLGLPFVPVNHMEGHLYSVWLATGTEMPPPPPFPNLSLIVSGGHTELVLMRGHGQYAYIGRTLDDAAGEAFDKVARVLGLGYPGGPAIERAAATSTSPTTLPRAWLPGTYDFSFSGLKTAVVHAAVAAATGQDPHAVRGRRLPRVDVAGGLSVNQVADLAAGFQEAVINVLTVKTARAARDFDVASVSLVGGVAANGPLRERMRELINGPLFIAERIFTTDNAAMIGAAAYFAPRYDANPDILPALELATSQ